MALVEMFVDLKPDLGRCSLAMIVLQVLVVVSKILVLDFTSLVNSRLHAMSHVSYNST